MSKTCVINQDTPFLDSDAQYLLVIASCLAKKLDSKKEPILSAVVNKFPYANVYENTGQKRTPGKIKIVGDGNHRRKIITAFSQIYPSTMDYPSDNKTKRLDWFVQALDEVAEIDDLKSICFPAQLARDGGGNWSYYYMAIKEFAQTIHLKSPHIKVYICHNDLLNGKEAPTSQVSLLNVVNLHSAVSLESLCFTPSFKKLQINKDSLRTNPGKTKKIQINFSKLKSRLDSKNDNDTPENKNNNGHLILDGDDETTDKVLDSEATNEVVIDNDNEALISDDEKDDVPNIDKSSQIQSIAIDEVSNDSTNSTNSNTSNNSKETKLKFKIKRKSTKNDKNKEDDKNKDDVDSNLNQKDDSNLNQEDDSNLNQEEVKVSSVYGDLPEFPVTKMNPDWVRPITKPLVHESWNEFFETPEIQEKLGETHKHLVKELESNGNVSRMLPSFDLIFNAFRLCPFNKIKVVILGQDPYPNPNHAMGLAFSVPKGQRVAQSLKNIFREILHEYPETYVEPKHGCLEKWAEQGVLLLNSALTLRSGARNSHQQFWNNTTDLIIKEISKQTAAQGKSLVFILWGGDAKKKKPLINTKKHLVLEAGHPSPMSIKWFRDCGHFKMCNQKLRNIGETEIDWQT
tara:strand:+ start:1689 stop:3572 length:1884 start_codon:yes stop_codon:yes gene_type:complete